jgi:hypothetical protein
MTPERAAQRELLSQAAQDCQRRHPFVDRFEFDRFDRLLWFYREGTAQTERDLFTSCYNERVSDLVKTGAATQATQARPSAGTGGAGRELPSDAWKDAPAWKIGDEWSYRWESPRGGGTFVWQVVREELVEGTDCYVVATGRYHLYFRKADLAYVQRQDRGDLDYKFTPARQYIAWPLHAGKTWEALYTQEWPRQRSTSNVLRLWRVEAKERVAVQAGAFDAFKIVERDKWSNTVSSELWVASEIKGMVKLHLHQSYGVEKWELTAYKLDGLRPAGSPQAERRIPTRLASTAAPGAASDGAK